MTRTTTRRLAVAAVLPAALLAAVLPSAAQAAGSPSQTKNIILLIGDGMGVTHVNAARQRYVGEDGRLEMEKLPAQGLVSTYAVERGTTKPNLVPDSASTSTAWSSGIKTYNGAIGVDTNGKPVETIMEQAKKAGMRTGNVSTAEVTDATPAGMYSHTLVRGCQGPVYSDASCLPKNADGSFVAKPADPLVTTPIAEQISRNGTADVVLGGGLARFEPDDQKALESKGYRVLGSFGDASLAPGKQTAATQQVPTRSDLAGVQGAGTKVVGLFNRGNLTVEKSKAAAPAGTPVTQEPTLPEMTSKAVELLKGGDKGFFLQVESALIDKRSHANDADQTLQEMKSFDESVRVAREFAAADGNTLVIVTADHECAGFNIIGKGSFANAEAAAPPGNVDGGNPANTSTPRREYAANKKDPARSTGPVNGSGSADPKNFAPATFRTADDPAEVKDGDPAASLWLTYVSGNHTGADVPIRSSGPESSRFVGNLDNTDIYRQMFAALQALGNEGTPPASPAADKPLAFRAIVQSRSPGAVIVAVNDVAPAQPGARVDVFYVDRGTPRFVRRLVLGSSGTVTQAPATFRLPSGSQQTFFVRVTPVDATSTETTSQRITTAVR